MKPNRGTLLDIGTNFYDAGRMTGKMATEILGGVDPATIPIPDKIPQKLVVNKQALKGLKDPWDVSGRHHCRPTIVAMLA